MVARDVSRFGRTTGFGMMAVADEGRENLESGLEQGFEIISLRPDEIDVTRLVRDRITDTATAGPGFDDLVADIQARGIETPPVVAVPRDGEPKVFRLISGFRRLTAHRILFGDAAPISVRARRFAGAPQEYAAMWAENYHRKEVGFAERALHLSRLRDRDGLALDDLPIALSSSEKNRLKDALCVPGEVYDLAAGKALAGMPRVVLVQLGQAIRARRALQPEKEWLAAVVERVRGDLAAGIGLRRVLQEVTADLGGPATRSARRLGALRDFHGRIVRDGSGRELARISVDENGLRIRVSVLERGELERRLAAFAAQ